MANKSIQIGKSLFVIKPRRRQPPVDDVLQAIGTIDAIYSSIMGQSKLQILDSNLDANLSLNIDAGEVNRLLRCIHGEYLVPLSDNVPNRFLVGESAEPSFDELHKVLYAIVGGMLMVRPHALPPIDKSVQTRGTTETAVDFGRFGADNHPAPSNTEEGYTNLAHDSKNYLCVFSVPKSATRMDRLRTLLTGSMIDGLSYRPKNGTPFSLGDRMLILVYVSSSTATPRRIYEALTRGGAIDGAEAYKGLISADPFVKRGGSDVAFSVFVSGTGRGFWRRYGTTEERRLALSFIEIY